MSGETWEFDHRHHAELSVEELRHTYKHHFYRETDTYLVDNTLAEDDCYGYIELGRLANELPEVAELQQAGWAQCGFWFEINSYTAQDITAMQQLNIHNERLQKDLDSQVGIKIMFELAKPLSEAEAQELLTQLKDPAEAETLRMSGKLKLITILSHASAPKFYIDVEGLDYDPHLTDAEAEPDFDQTIVPTDQLQQIQALYRKVKSLAIDSLSRQ